jgi:Ulp1 family protease
MDKVLLDHLAHWLQDEAAGKCNGRVLDTSGWKRLAPKNIPQQRNSYDCGMFAIM